jgi:gliding motility-associated-like protein
VIPIVPPCPNDGNVYRDLNPYWYKFTCFTSGTLGLIIKPNNDQDDYDWQLFDITGHDPNDVYTVPSLAISCNWSGETGTTGASAAGTQQMVCGSISGGPFRPLFSSMPTIIKGHQYLLMISHFTGDQQSGYQLWFTGGTGSITDPTLPGLVSARASCDGYIVTVVTNKKMKCATLAANGSDFTVTGHTVTAASGMGCSNGFDLDTVLLTLSTPLPPGNYTVTINNGADNNTLLDNCDRNITAGSNVPLAVLPIRPTPMDSLTTPACAPASLQLVFKKNIRCSSIAADGSDFIVTGPSAIRVSGAHGTCSNGLSSTITVTLAAPVVNQGTYQITLQQGSDGNTIIDECGQETPAGAMLSFFVKDTVSAAFTYNVTWGCKADTVVFLHDGSHGVNQWAWQFDTLGSSILQNPEMIFTKFGDKTITLAVSNGFCSDTVTNIISLSNQLTAAFTSTYELCPEDPAVFNNYSVGDIIGWTWNFGDGNTSTEQSPPPEHYPLTGKETWYTISLIVRNNAGCADTTAKKIKVLKTCYIAVPSAFSPNGDGNNDYLYPLNAYKADHLEFKVYNRLGQLVFQTTDWTVRWNGRIKGQLQSAGTFIWTLQYTDRDSGKNIFQKGTTILVR